MFTSPAGVVAKYCDEYVCLWVCLSVCPRGYLRDHTRDLYQIFMHVAYVRGSVVLRHVYDRPHRLSPERSFLPHCKCIISRRVGLHSAGEVCYTILRCLCLVVTLLCIVKASPKFVFGTPMTICAVF